MYIDLFSTLDEALSESLQMDCNKHDVGITIIAVRVTKVPGPSFQTYWVCVSYLHALTCPCPPPCSRFPQPRIPEEVRKCVALLTPYQQTAQLD